MFGMKRGDRGTYLRLVIRIGLAIAVGAIVGSAIAALAAEGPQAHQDVATAAGGGASAAASESSLGS